MLARQLRLRLVAEGNDIPRSCSNVPVSIHAIATFQAFNGYLRPKITAMTAAADRASTSAPTGGAASGRLSSVLAAFAQAARLSGSQGADGLPVPGTSSSRLSSSLGTLEAGPSSGARSTSGAASSTNKEKPERRRSSRLSGKSSLSASATDIPGAAASAEAGETGNGPEDLE